MRTKVPFNGKLEAGKFYETKNGETVECLAAWSRPLSSGSQASMVRDGKDYADEYTLDGKCEGSILNSFDVAFELAETEEREYWIILFDDESVGIRRTEDSAKYTVDKGGGKYYRAVINVPVE